MKVGVARESDGPTPHLDFVELKSDLINRWV